MPSLFLEVKVRPGAQAGALVRAPDGHWEATLKSPPEHGKANAELIGLVARQFGCARSAVTIKRGAASRRKLLEIATGPG